MSINLVEKFAEISNKRVKELANEIRDEIKSEIANGHIKTGDAYNSIEIHYNNPGYAGGNFASGAEGNIRGGFLSYVWIGSNAPSMYYLDEGNGGHNTIITSTRSHDARGRRPGKLGEYPDGIPGYGWRASVHGYDGFHIMRSVADRHR